jgi:hypothetical protein
MRRPRVVRAAGSRRPAVLLVVVLASTMAAACGGSSALPSVSASHASADGSLASGDPATPAATDPAVLPAPSPEQPMPRVASSPSPTQSATPTAASWQTAAKMLTPHAAHTATLLGDGRVLVAGGKTGLDRDHVSASAELFDPGSGRWTTTGSMTKGRWGHTATPLSDGRVLVVGGLTRYDHQLASAELYEPASGSWSATDALHDPRDGHTATLLATRRPSCPTDECS